MVVKLVHRTVRTLRSNKTRSICQADGTASNLHPFQLSVFLRESKCTSSSINRQCIGSFFIRRLVSGRNLLQSGNVVQFITPRKEIIPLLIRYCQHQSISPLDSRRNSQCTRTVSRNVGTVHLSLFHHFHSPLIGHRRQLYIFIGETASIRIQKIVPVLYSQFAVKLTVKAINPDLNRTPHLLDGKITSLFFVVRSYNTISSIIAAVVNESIHIHTLHALVSQHPKKTSGTTRMFTHHFPIIIQSCSMAPIIQPVQEFGRHKYFWQTHIVLAFSIRTIVHSFISAEVALRMKHRTFLRIIFMKFTIQFSIPAFFITIAPPDNTRMVYITGNHFFYQLLPVDSFVLAMPATQFIHYIKSQRVTSFKEFGISRIMT